MTYQPREFWEQRLAEQFDLRGTGETGLSLAYNRACYRLRRRVLERTLAKEGIAPNGRTVLDVGCGTGFFTQFYVERGARVTGLDITATSVERLRERFPESSFLLSDVSEVSLDQRYDIINAFDVLYHIVDDARWERALRNLATAVAPGGLLLVTDVFSERPGLAEHNRMRSLDRYRAVLEPAGLVVRSLTPTHVLLNRELHAWRFLNRLPELLYAIDSIALASGLAGSLEGNKLLAARRI